MSVYRRTQVHMEPAKSKWICWCSKTEAWLDNRYYRLLRNRNIGNLIGQTLLIVSDVFIQTKGDWLEDVQSSFIRVRRWTLRSGFYSWFHSTGMRKNVWLLEWTPRADVDMLLLLYEVAIVLYHFWVFNHSYLDYDHPEPIHHLIKILLHADIYFPWAIAWQLLQMRRAWMKNEENAISNFYSHSA